MTDPFSPHPQKMFQMMMLAFVTVALLLVCAMAGKSAPPEVLSHQHAEEVLYPKFIAAINEWRIQHPKGEDHYSGFDVQDHKRFREAVKAFHAFEEEMKRGGF